MPRERCRLVVVSGVFALLLCGAGPALGKPLPYLSQTHKKVCEVAKKTARLCQTATNDHTKLSKARALLSSRLIKAGVPGWRQLLQDWQVFDRQWTFKVKPKLCRGPPATCPANHGHHYNWHDKCDSCFACKYRRTGMYCTCPPAQFQRCGTMVRELMGWVRQTDAAAKRYMQTAMAFRADFKRREDKLIAHLQRPRKPQQREVRPATPKTAGKSRPDPPKTRETRAQAKARMLAAAKAKCEGGDKAGCRDWIVLRPSSRHRAATSRRGVAVRAPSTFGPMRGWLRSTNRAVFAGSGRAAPSATRRSRP